MLTECAQLRREIDSLPVIARDLADTTYEERVDEIERIIALIVDTHLPRIGRYGRHWEILGTFDDLHYDPAVDRVRELVVGLADADVDDLVRIEELIFDLHAVLSSWVSHEEEMRLKLAAAARERQPRRPPARGAGAPRPWPASRSR